MNSYAQSSFRHALTLGMLFISAVILLTTVGCNSGPSMTPETFVQNFIQKHIPMIDLSVADFYVKEEQAGIIARIKAIKAANSKKSNVAAPSTATYDFSKIKVEIIDEKEEYINDEAVTFLKVAAIGNYTKTRNGKSETVAENEVIILESIAGEWKVTEKTNPWN
ncbi:MAG: hypothetical protein JSW20_08365 [Nitrospiraceae bacterium]|nr:MAG: hypothetical protein JSW20_08365 [Nitrospiraceae bacterium]